MFIAAIFAPVIPEVIGTMTREFEEKQKEKMMKGSTADGELPDESQPLNVSKVSIPTKDIKTNIPDKGTALSEMSFAFGSIVGPILGGGLEVLDGYDFAVDVMAVVAAVFAAAYFVIAVGCSCC